MYHNGNTIQYACFFFFSFHGLSLCHPKSLFLPVVRRRVFLLGVHPKAVQVAGAERGGKWGKYLLTRTVREARDVSAEGQRKEEGAW